MFLLLIQSKVYAVEALLLFGGDNHKTFLGCLNCGKFDSGSICNKFGTYGSKFSSESPWNKFSSSAPIIVDQNGGSYGYFSTNKFHSDRTRIQGYVALLNWVAENDDLDQARDALCGN